MQLRGHLLSKTQSSRVLQILEQSYYDLLLKAGPALVCKQLEAEVLSALLLEDQKNVTKNAKSLLCLEVYDSVLLVFPALHQTTQALFQSEFYSLCQSLCVRLHSLLDGNVTVEVQDVEDGVLLARHQIKAKKVDEHNSNLGLPLDLRYRVEEFVLPSLRHFAPLLEYSDFVATLEMALGQAAQVLREYPLFVLFYHQAQVESLSIAIHLLLQEQESAMEPSVQFFDSAETSQSLLREGLFMLLDCLDQAFEE